ncbi:MAG: Xaa-Pro peptidase family protein [Isosphaeraceae bacterium]
MLTDRYAERREKLRCGLQEDDLHALLVSSPTNVSYLTGFTGDSSALLLGRERDVLVSDGRFTTQIAQECPDLEAVIRPAAQTMNQAIAGVVAKLDGGRLGFEAAALSVAEFQSLTQALPDHSLVATTERVETLRQIKDASEIQAIRQAVDFAERAFLMVRPQIRPGMTEKEVADLLESSLRLCGATASSFPPIVAVGRNAALPHARPTETARIGDEDFVLFDWGATGRPYKSDLTRVVVTGKVTPEFERVYETVLEAQERAIASIRPGVLAHDVDAEARSFIEQAGFGRFFDHGLGHGLGMEIHEAPRLRRESNTILQPGMIVTVEPGIYLPGWGGIRIEDDVLVTPEGREVLSRLPKALDAVGV